MEKVFLCHLNILEYVMSTNKQQKSNIEDIPDDALADKVHKMIEQNENVKMKQMKNV